MKLTPKQDELIEEYKRLECNYGIPVHIGKKIIKKYGTKTIQQLQENPYKVADQVASLGFKTIDPIALRIGIDEKSDYRIQSAFLYLLNQAEQEGHVYLPENILLRNASNLLGFSVSFLRDSLLRSNLKRVEDQSEIYVYRPWKYKEEIDITHILVKLAGQRESDIKKQEETLLQQYSDTANEEQLNAVRQALRSSLMILTGGPGTGKTFTTNLVIRFLKNRGKKILLAAPTGRAAKRMEESTGMSSQTIHRLLEYGRDDIGNIGFQRNENNPLETDTVIIDESSMIDQSLMYALLKAVPKNCQLILVGDKNQLPSVGAGRILADIIAADICPVIELKKIYRQSEESYIAEAAHGILEGKVPYPWGKDKKIKDFYFIPVDYSDKEKAATVISEYAGKKVPAFANNDVQVLTMTRVRATGCQELNEKIKEITNPSDRSKREYKNFREGDKVIQMKNNYKLERIYPDKKKSIGVSDYTIEGRLIGHIVLADEMILEKVFLAKQEGHPYPSEKVSMLRHMILSHHGTTEWGSPVAPAILEAEVLHQIDYMDSRLIQYTDAYNKLEAGEMSERIYGLGSSVVRPGFYKNS